MTSDAHGITVIPAILLGSPGDLPMMMAVGSKMTGDSVPGWRWAIGAACPAAGARELPAICMSGAKRP